MNVKPCGARVLIEPIAGNRVTPGGIELPEVTSIAPYHRGTVVATGLLQNNHFLPGTVVLYRSHEKVDIPGPDGQKFHLVDEERILAQEVSS